MTSKRATSPETTTNGERAMRDEHPSEPERAMFSEDTLEEERPILLRLARADIRAAAALRSEDARYLVDAYYDVQQVRLAVQGRLRAAGEGEEPDALDPFHAWLHRSLHGVERYLVPALGAWAKAQPPGEWLLNVYGIGPVLAAGFLAHIDITKAPTISALWRYAGLDPTSVWAKGEKRPWNASLKVLCWKAGESFVRFSGREACHYGHLYRQRKDYEVQRDLDGLHAEQAAAATGRKLTAPQRVTYESGHLPAVQLDRRARRYAVKRFLSDLWVVWRTEAGLEVREPYITATNPAHHYEPPFGYEPRRQR